MASNGQTNGTVSDDHRKLFAGGLSWETTETQLKEYFGKYGEIESINLKTDPNTGKSRGFAFIVFNSADAIDAVVNAGEHTINNKKIDAKKAKAKQGKLFVGGLTAELTDDDIKNHFGQFGSIVQVELPFDKVKNQRKAFCFITYESEQTVNDILKNPKQTIKDKEVDVKKATPKPDQGRGGFGGFGGRGGARGRSRGGYGNQNWNQGYGGYGGYDQAYGGGYDAYGGGYGGYGYDNYGGGYQTGGNQRGGGRGRNQRHQPY
ncbi:unnamed protein product [Brassicogethes aeneus]|uniref:RRM domain-containing protein n=1 Tax=Brassicogethes aeneus TaxID=1431903 RepID=A0A9P0AYX8_BRAAE|nr:unnamed protein product [Brassicogethes aeneus]